MNLFGWIVVGLIAGVIAKLVMREKLGLIYTLAAGVVGAFFGGWLFSLFGGPGVSGFNLTSILVAAVGAVIVLFVFRLLSRRS